MKTLRAHWSLLGGFGLALLSWLAESLMHLRLSYDGDFGYALLPIQDANELWMRSLIAALFVGFGISVDAVLARLRRVHQERANLVDQLEESTHDLGERVKELGCLYRIDELARREGSSIEEVLEEAAQLIPSSWQYPEIAEGRIIYEGKEYTAKSKLNPQWRQAADIVIGRASVGTIEVHYTQARPELYEGPFLEEERNLINSIAVRLAGIIERKRAEEALRESEARFQHLSRTDGLTGLLNRRGWNECLGEEERRAQRHGHPSCVMIADLDGLKETNDQEGHAAGDELLRCTAECIQDAVREVDKVARIGGDEFAILAIQCDEDAADAMAKRIEDAWVADGIRASWGIAMRSDNTELEGAMAEADRLMYEMKAERRASLFP